MSEDIIRLGTGRSDGLRGIGSDFFARLTTKLLDTNHICSRLRIVVVSAVSSNRESEANASERLGRVARDPQAAWKVLVEYSRQLIRVRGKATPDQIYRELSLAGVPLKTSEIETRVQLQAGVREWLQKTYAEISILGVNSRVSFDECWLSLDAHLLKGGPTAHEDLDKALKHYHEYSYRHSSEQSFDSHTIGRFVNKCVVLGGPGIGKSTLLKKLALEYARDGFLTLLVRLPQVVALVTREGRRFEDSLVNIALSGSGVRASSTSLDGAVILCDGLDECGSQQPLVTAALHAFSIAHPTSRIVIASRPIGYRAGEISDWRHYELQPLKDTEAEQALSRVLRAIPFATELLREKAITLAKQQLRTRSIQGAASRSPLMLTLIAALSAKGIDPGSGKAALYRQLFQLIEDHPPPRMGDHLPSEPERRRFLELLGWSLMAYGNEPADHTLKRCAKWWTEEMGTTLLASKTRVGECCHYWECLGVLERVRTLTQEAITFVHKTFGEFAAARYISQSSEESQRTLVARAIQTTEWKEALSFASHLGLASLILEVWTELALDGDPEAGHGLDDAMELVVQSGVTITGNTLNGFAACCWKIVGDDASRARFAAGEALCIMAKAHWQVARLGAIERREDTDNWSKLVAWACLSVSQEQDLPVPELVAILRNLSDLMPRQSYRGGLRLGANGNLVRQQLILSATKRILQKGPDADGLDTLRGMFSQQTGSLSVSTIGKLSSLFEEIGFDTPLELQNLWPKHKDWLAPNREEWIRRDCYFLDVLDDPSLYVEGTVAEDLAQYWELGGLLTASRFWETPAAEAMNLCSENDALQLRRMVMHAVAKAADLDLRRLILQVRACRGRILNADCNELTGLFDLPRVDVAPQFETALIGVERVRELEQVILGGGEFFPLNATLLLYELRDRPEFLEAIERLVTNGRGVSLRFAAVLTHSLPEKAGESMLLKRLCTGEITSGCRHLYQHLEPPFDVRHLNAARRGLECNLAHVANAAAELAAKLPYTTDLATELRDYFTLWMTKEDPYPKKGGVIPDSPRDKLASILTTWFADDHEFLIILAKDDRSDVRSAAREPILRAATESPPLRKLLIQETELNALDPILLRAVITEGLFSNTEALEVMRLLLSDIASVRYAALPILNAAYLPVELIQAESMRLLSDDDMDIREAASHVLKKLSQVPPGLESRSA
ncbi:NACHT domain-containing protein [Pseudomonas salomonii]|uniref:NACHT domain-containing protein n=1 Tax=Pseudomonas salomonii TaxID=191391 RepID=UPI001FC97F3D|nr:NTPase [Pseudomonas salomonii]